MYGGISFAVFTVFFILASLIIVFVFKVRVLDPDALLALHKDYPLSIAAVAGS